MQRSSIVTITLTAALVAVAAHPALAATTTLQEIKTGAQNIESVVTYIGYIASIIGLVVAALHYFNHRDDLFGTAQRVIGSLFAGYLITHVTTIMGWSGTAAVFK